MLCLRWLAIGLILSSHDVKSSMKVDFTCCWFLLMVSTCLCSLSIFLILQKHPKRVPWIGPQFSQTKTISTLTRAALFDTFIQIVFLNLILYSDQDVKESILIKPQVFIHPFDRVSGLVTLQLSQIFHPKTYWIDMGPRGFPSNVSQELMVQTSAQSGKEIQSYPSANEGC